MASAALFGVPGQEKQDRWCPFFGWLFFLTFYRRTPMKESEIVNKIRSFLKSTPECFFWKEHGGMYGTAGIPDIICCYRGRFYGFEVKNEIGRPTKLQEATIRKIREAGGVAVIVRSVEEVRTTLEGETLPEEKK